MLDDLWVLDTHTLAWEQVSRSGQVCCTRTSHHTPRTQVQT